MDTRGRQSSSLEELSSTLIESDTNETEKMASIEPQNPLEKEDPTTVIKGKLTALQHRLAIRQAGAGGFLCSVCK